MSTTNTTLISIIMPTYNRAKLITGTIASIQQQSHTCWELIIVDDGSDDDTENVIQQINDSRIQLIKAGRIGIGGTIKNIGLHHARGNWIAFMDSDDLWHPQKLEKQLLALQQNPRASFSLTGGYNFKKEGNAEEYFYTQKGVYTGNIFSLIFQSKIAVFAQALLFRKSCLDKVGLLKETGSFSDVDFITALAYDFDAVLLYEPLLYRRLHDSNYIHTAWKKSYYAGISTIVHFQAEKKLPQSLAKSALYRLFINFGESALEHKENKFALQQFYIAWCIKPFKWVSWKKWMKGVVYYFKR
ncbi:MAG: glycosyltransferase family 2 protein [Bacteroidetes bacterium]|nr:glycosyltransferase family 2 protein [Bacteroidota bacterium]